VSKRPTIDLNDVRRKLKKLGFVLARSSKHETWQKGNRFVQVSHGNDDVGQTLLKNICRQLGMTVDEFMAV
jgi:predicted RNA binding protein YcfA (HicA-like mRNA interferase family)